MKFEPKDFESTEFNDYGICGHEIDKNNNPIERTVLAAKIANAKFLEFEKEHKHALECLAGAGKKIIALEDAFFTLEKDFIQLELDYRRAAQLKTQDIESLQRTRAELSALKSEIENGIEVEACIEGNIPLAGWDRRMGFEKCNTHKAILIRITPIEERK